MRRLVDREQILVLVDDLDVAEQRLGQQARVGVSQAFPWPGILSDREDAAAMAARAAWRQFEAARLEVTERVVETLHEVAYLDGAIRITAENLELLSSFEEVVRARYRVGAGSHPELIRVQVELGQLEDRLAQLRAMRPTYVADLNAALNRATDVPVSPFARLPGRVASVDGPGLAEIARRSNPVLLALDERIEEQRIRSEVARKEGLPDFTVGLDYIVTDEAIGSAIAESGDDPVLLTFGLSLPIWGGRIQAGRREARARGRSARSRLADQTRSLEAALQKALFDRRDAERKVALYGRTLIPKAEEAQRALSAAYQTGEGDFLSLLDIERTLLNYRLEVETAKVASARAAARIQRLRGR